MQRPVNIIGVMLVAKTGVPVSNTMSRANCDVGEANRTICPSSSRSRSLQAIISEDQRKSLRNMISLSFAPIQAKVVVAGFENVLTQFWLGGKFAPPLVDFFE